MSICLGHFVWCSAVWIFISWQGFGWVLVVLYQAVLSTCSLILQKHLLSVFFVLAVEYVKPTVTEGYLLDIFSSRRYRSFDQIVLWSVCDIVVVSFTSCNGLLHDCLIPFDTEKRSWLLRWDIGRRRCQPIGLFLWFCIIFGLCWLIDFLCHLLSHRMRRRKILIHLVEVYLNILIILSNNFLILGVLISSRFLHAIIWRQLLLAYLPALSILFNFLLWWLRLGNVLLYQIKVLRSLPIQLQVPLAKLWNAKVGRRGGQERLTARVLYFAHWVGVGQSCFVVWLVMKFWHFIFIL